MDTTTLQTINLSDLERERARLAFDAAENVSGAAEALEAVEGQLVALTRAGERARLADAERLRRERADAERIEAARRDAVEAQLAIADAKIDRLAEDFDTKLAALVALGVELVAASVATVPLERSLRTPDRRRLLVPDLMARAIAAAFGAASVGGQSFRRAFDLPPHGWRRPLHDLIRSAPLPLQPPAPPAEEGEEVDVDALRVAYETARSHVERLTFAIANSGRFAGTIPQGELDAFVVAVRDLHEKARDLLPVVVGPERHALQDALATDAREHLQIRSVPVDLLARITPAPAPVPAPAAEEK